MEDIEAARVTKRVVVPELEEILYKEHKVLDHGFVRVVDYMGADSAIVQAARVSYGKGTKKLSQDAALIGYLMRHAHTSPFEMCEIKFHIKLPIFVARQWVRHRTANINECSARYSVLENEFYIPEEDQVREQATDNAQGRGEPLSASTVQRILTLFNDNASKMYNDYEEMLNHGLARELARMNLTLNCYTHWYWKIDLHNLLKFITLRSAKGAQYELRAYVEKISEIVSAWVPISYKAFVDYCLESKTFSKNAIEVIRAMLNGKNVCREDTEIGKREWNELMSVLYPEGK